MNRKTLTLGILFLTGISVSIARADEISSETSIGTGTTSETLTYDGEQNKDSPGKWNWNFSYARNSAELGATAANSAIPSGFSADHTNTFLVGAGYSKIWQAGGALTYASTKEENLSNFGPSIYVGYTFNFGDKAVVPKAPKASQLSANETPDEGSDDSEGSEKFSPNLNLRLTGGSNSYNQDLNVTPVRSGSRRANSPSRATTQGINQKSIALAATLVPLKWFEVKLSFTKYSYDRSVSQFQSFLDQPRAIATGASNFSSTLSGFSSKDVSLGLNFFLPLDFDVGFELSRATGEASGLRTDGLKITVSRTWTEHWKTGLGYDRYNSSVDSQILGSVDLSYLF